MTAREPAHERRVRRPSSKGRRSVTTSASYAGASGTWSFRSSLFSAAGFGVAFLVPKEYRARTEVDRQRPGRDGLAVFAAVGFSIPHKHLLTTIPQDVKSAEFLAPLDRAVRHHRGVPNSRFRASKQKLYRAHAEEARGPAGARPKRAPTSSSSPTSAATPSASPRSSTRSARKWQDDFMKRYGNVRPGGAGQHPRRLQRGVGEVHSTRPRSSRTSRRRTAAPTSARIRRATPPAKLEKPSRPTSSEFELELEGWEGTLQRINEQLEDAFRTRRRSTRARSAIRSGSSRPRSSRRGAAAIRTMEQTFTDEWPKLKEAKRLLRGGEGQAREDRRVHDRRQEHRAASASWLKLNNDKAEAQNEIAVLKKRIAKPEAGDRPARRRTSSSFRRRPRKAQELRDAVDAAYRAVREGGPRARGRERTRASGWARRATSFFRVTHELTPEEAKFLTPCIRTSRCSRASARSSAS